MYTALKPIKGRMDEEIVRITWQDGRVTDSKLTWYGNFAKKEGVPGRSEYRLTRFGKDFPFLNSNTVGHLFVLIPTGTKAFNAYVLDTEDDIEEIQAVLGIEAFDSWGVYYKGAPQVETESECVERRYKEFARKLTDFPTGEVFSAEAIAILEACKKSFGKGTLDAALMEAMEAEYGLFRHVERKLCEPDVLRTFGDIDDFLNTAGRIMNRRKSRAGRSLENHVEHFLKKSGVPHKMRADEIPGKPDVVIPSVGAYNDASYPVDRLFIVGVKTTCKDRWRQVLNEGKRVPVKHIITTQRGISITQLQEMKDANVTLVVPKSLHSKYPKKSPLTLVTVEDFVKSVKTKLP